MSTKKYTCGLNNTCFANKFRTNFCNANPLSSYKTCSLSFLGYNVHIFDGGAHADNMEHFAKSLSSDMDIKMHYVDVNPKSPYDKQIKSLCEELKKIPPKTSEEEEYIALPGLCNVPIQSIEVQYQNVMGESISLTPENIKANKAKLLEFLKKISENPITYDIYIDYIDPIKQGMQYVYPAIQEINKLIENGYKVYISGGHPEYQTLRWLAETNNKKAELRHYIAKGSDINGEVAKMRRYIQAKGWYDFNLLNLSNAHIVNLKDTSGKKDYIYAAYDSTITDGARGVYNFYPVRDSLGNVKGYSYSNRSSIDYPYDKFLANDSLENLLKFVGRYYKDVLATKRKTEEFKEMRKISPKMAEKEFANTLFDVNDIFTPEQIEIKKIKLKGKYVDSSLKLFFDKNPNTDEIIFPNCDCEGSGRPSVLSMWGSCFSIFNAIKDDIEKAEQNKKAWQDCQINYSGFNYAYSSLDKERLNAEWRLEEARKYEDYPAVEKWANKTLDLRNTITRNIPKDYLDHKATAAILPYAETGRNEIYKILIDALLKQYKYEAAKDVLNSYIDELCCTCLQKCTTARHLSKIPKIIDMAQRANIQNNQLRSEYESAMTQWENASFIRRLFLSEPVQPKYAEIDYHELSYAEQTKDSIVLLGSLYEDLGDICEKLGEAYPAKVCKAAAKDINNYTERGSKIIQRRIEHTQYIGDLYDEIKPD